MNMIFALVMFPVALSSGISSMLPLVRAVPGTPAWHAQIPDGSRVLTANGKEVFDWLHIPTEVAIGGSDPVELEILTPGSESPTRYVLQPERNENMGMYMVGLAPAVNPERTIEVTEGGPAYRAGLRSGDRLLAVENGLPGFAPEQQFRMAFGKGSLDLRVERAGEELSFQLTPERPESEQNAVFGISPLENQVADLRQGTGPEALGLRVADRVLAVDGMPVVSRDDIFTAIGRGNGALRLDVQRDGQQVALEGEAMDQAARVAFLSDLALEQDKDSAGILVMDHTGAAAAGLQDGDRVLALDRIPVDTGWEDIEQAAHNAVAFERPLAFTVERGGEILELTADALPAPILDYGMGMAEGRYIYSTSGFLPSMKAGALASWRFLSEAWLTLQKMFQREVSTKNLGGIITIGQVSYHWSAMGWTKLLFFLCMVSVNLAFLNVLPIPVLDGGHLFFLLVEGIKGSPVSERTLGYSQVVGVVLILSLMVYVTYQDILRLVS